MNTGHDPAPPGEEGAEVLRRGGTPQRRQRYKLLRNGARVEQDWRGSEGETF